MSNESLEIVEKLGFLLGEKKNGKYILTEGITVVVEEQNDSSYLWFEDRRGEHAFAWLFNIEKTERGYKFFSDKYEYIEKDSLDDVFAVVKERKIKKGGNGS